MRRILGTLALASLVLVSLWALQGRDTTTSAEGQTPSPTTSAAQLATPTLTTRAPAPSATPSHDPFMVADPVDPDGIPVDPTAAAIPRDDTQAALFATYEQAAVAFLTDFARPTTPLTEEEWWAHVEDQLTDTAAADYNGTDPQQVPFTTITGPAVILPTLAPTDLLIIARVPTDAGYYRVHMERDTTGIHISQVTPETTGETP